jgi:hypothetical protein
MGDNGTVDSTVNDAGREWANLDSAAARGEKLWALELDDHRRPIVAHLIDRIDAGDDRRPTAYHTACGQKLSPTLSGCWSTKDDDLPLASSAVHCGQPTQ